MRVVRRVAQTPLSRGSAGLAELVGGSQSKTATAQKRDDALARRAPAAIARYAWTSSAKDSRVSHLKGMQPKNNAEYVVTKLDDCKFFHAPSSLNDHPSKCARFARRTDAANHRGVAARMDLRARVRG